MHRCLAIIEVQHIIFREASYQSQRKAMLAVLARTCRAFSNVALDLLWDELTSFVHLIQCLPRNLWTVDETSKQMQFRRPMWHDDWDIISRYASRVRTVSFRFNRSCSGLADRVILSLSRPPRFGPLLPNLRSLRWTDSSDKYDPLLHILFAGSLVDITITSFALRSPSILMRLACTSPSLRRLVIADDSEPLDSRGEKNLSETIMRLRSLESFSSGPALHGLTVIHMSRLPSLFELSLELQDSLGLDVLKHRLVSPVFKSLRCLTLKIGDLPTLTSLLEVVHFAPHAVSFSAEKTPISDALHLFFTTLVKACDLEVLSTILFTNIADEWPGTDDLPDVSLSTLEPLLALPNVESFTFNSMCNISFDDDTLDALAKRWPRLTRLSLNKSLLWGNTSRVTYRGLINLLSRCTALKYFALEVDFTEVDSGVFLTSRPGNGITGRCERVDFISSTLEDPGNIAAFLSDLFPKLHKVSSSWDTSSEVKYLKRWEEVDSLLPKFLAVRVQCKEWYEGGKCGAPAV